MQHPRLIKSQPRFSRWLLHALVLMGYLLSTPPTLASSNNIDQPLLISEYSNVNLSKHSRYFIDSAGKLKHSHIQQSSSIQWNAVQREHLNLGFNKGAIWIETKIKSAQDFKEPWLLNVDYPPLDFISFFIYKNGTLIDSIHSGDKRPFSQRRLSSKNYLYRLVLQKNDEFTFKVRVQSSGSIQIPLRLTPLNEYITKDVQENMFTSAVYGILLVMGLYNLFIAVVARDKNYYIYVSWVFTSLLFLAAVNGDGFQILWPNHPGINDYFLPLMFCGSGLTNTLFALKFMEIERNRPKLSLLLYAIILGYCACLLLALSGNYSNSLRAVFLNNSIALITLSISCIYLTYYKQTNAKIFLLSYSILIISAITLSLDTANLIPHSLFTKYANQIGIVLETIIFSLALARKIKQERNLREIKEKEATALSIEADGNLKKYQELFNNSPIGIFHCSLTGKITTCNSAFLKILKLENLSEKNDIQSLLFTHLSDYKRTIENLTLNQGINTLDIELPRIYPTKWISLTLLSFPSNIKGETLFEGHITDITSEKLIEIKHQESEQDKLRMLSRLVSGVAHEINTPIGTNITARSLMESEIQDLSLKIDNETVSNNDLHSFIANLNSITDIFNANDQRISTLVNRFKEVSINRLNMQESTIDLTPIFRRIISDNKHKKCNIHLNCSAEKIITYTYENALEEILNQLIENSEQYSGLNHPDIEITLSDRIDSISLIYQDNGKGIDQEILEHVFDPFFTTRPGDPERTGLGLFVVYNLCHQLLGGTPTISNQNGFHFQCIFPKREPPKTVETG